MAGSGWHLMREAAAFGRRGLEQQEHSSWAVVGVYEGDADPLNRKLGVQGKSPDAAGVHTHVPDEQVARDMAAVYYAC